MTTPRISNLELSKEGLAGVQSKTVDVSYRKVIGSLFYAALATRPEITFSVGLLARFCESPGFVHRVALKGKSCYCRTKAGMCIEVTGNQDLDI